jgi:hypothetical protein
MSSVVYSGLRSSALCLAFRRERSHLLPASARSPLTKSWPGRWSPDSRRSVLIAIAYEAGQPTAMVQVRMRQHTIIDVFRVDAQRLEVTRT